MKLDFEKAGGLIPAIIQDDYTNKVLMLGFMNQEDWAKTQETGKLTLTKGENCGNFLEVVSIQENGSQDALLIKVCYTGTDTCFNESNKEDIMFLKYLQDFIIRRRQEMPEGSYTTTLFNKGIGRIAQKVGEEAVETVIEAMDGNDERLMYEGSDLLFHLIVMLTYKGYRIEDLANELKKRHK
jgi:phosphoribosyl-ATP pyrophosphohydrolase/phosphoribosyl-AMP cyclohydrolase